MIWVLTNFFSSPPPQRDAVARAVSELGERQQRASTQISTFFRRVFAQKHVVDESSAFDIQRITRRFLDERRTAKNIAATVIQRTARMYACVARHKEQTARRFAAAAAVQRQIRVRQALREHQLRVCAHTHAMKPWMKVKGDGEALVLTWRERAAVR